MSLIYIIQTMQLDRAQSEKKLRKIKFVQYYATQFS